MGVCARVKLHLSVTILRDRHLNKNRIHYTPWPEHAQRPTPQVV